MCVCVCVCVCVRTCVCVPMHVCACIFCFRVWGRERFGVGGGRGGVGGKVWDTLDYWIRLAQKTGEQACCVDRPVHPECLCCKGFGVNLDQLKQSVDLPHPLTLSHHVLSTSSPSMYYTPQLHSPSDPALSVRTNTVSTHGTITSKMHIKQTAWHQTVVHITLQVLHWSPACTGIHLDKLCSWSEFCSFSHLRVFQVEDIQNMIMLQSISCSM